MKNLKNIYFPFQDVQAVDNTKYFIEILEQEVKDFIPKEKEVVKEYSQKDYDDIVSGKSDISARFFHFFV